MTTKSGFRVAIKAFLPCGTTAAELIAAKERIAEIEDAFDLCGFVDFRLDDRFVVSHRIASADATAAGSESDPAATEPSADPLALPAGMDRRVPKYPVGGTGG